MKVVIIIPTYNEKENIGRLLDVLDKEFKKYPKHKFQILVVDDNSPDGTAEVVKKKKKQRSYIHLIVREGKLGLGSTYIEGFKHVLKKMDAEVVIEMDADFQHDPKDVIRFVNEIEKGTDYVIGSRFIEGGSIPREWQLYRKILSLGGSLFIKFVLGLFTLTDFTTGFKATRVKGCLDKLDFDTVLSEGFAYKIDLLYKMHKMGANIKEIPIVFGLRNRGDSKMERRNFMDSLKVVLTIRYKENKSFFRFCVVGFIGLGVDTSIFNILWVISLTSLYASYLSGIIALTTTFVLNNLWSFNDRRKTRVVDLLRSYILFAFFSYIPILFRSWLVNFSTSRIGNTFIVANTTFFVGIVIGLIWNFTVYSRIIWKQNKYD